VIAVDFAEAVAPVELERRCVVALDLEVRVRRAQ